jgi:CRISPR-associated protein (TIGR02710 family)
MTDTRQETGRYVLLVCSVGGTSEPVAVAIRHWRPARILFLCSKQTRALIKTALDAAAAAGFAVSPGCFDQTVLSDPQDLQQTLRDLRPLDQHVRDWQQRGEEYAVVADFTGGTKVMSAALALVAHRWKCTFAYVGGQRRTKGGVGVVETGAERVVHFANPWDALGYQAVEDAVTVFNHGGYAAAAHLLDGAMKNADKPEVKRELSTLKAVVDAYAAWDRFDHKEAAQRFADALKNRNDLAAVFPHESSSLIQRLQRHCDLAAQLAVLKEPTVAWVADLLHNARRRAAERRFDDAVARLYRAFEALAQVRLREQYGIPDTKAVPLEKLPQRLRTEWAGRARVRGATLRERSSPDASSGDSPIQVREHCVMLGLRDAYALLESLDDHLGRQFFNLGLADDHKSPLVARNQSILAHGFQPVDQKVYHQLDEKLCSLVSVGLADSLDWRLPAPR